MSSAELNKENMIDDAMLTDEMFELLPDSEKNSEFIAMIADKLRLKMKISA